MSTKETDRSCVLGVGRASRDVTTTVGISKHLVVETIALPLLLQKMCPREMVLGWGNYYCEKSIEGRESWYWRERGDTRVSIVMNSH